MLDMKLNKRGATVSEYIVDFISYLLAALVLVGAIYLFRTAAEAKVIGQTSASTTSIDFGGISVQQFLVNYLNSPYYSEVAKNEKLTVADFIALNYETGNLNAVKTQIVKDFNNFILGKLQGQCYVVMLSGSGKTLFNELSGPKPLGGCPYRSNPISIPTKKGNLELQLVG